MRAMTVAERRPKNHQEQHPGSCHCLARPGVLDREEK